jgi:hypothetical protein
MDEPRFRGADGRADLAPGGPAQGSAFLHTKAVPHADGREVRRSACLCLVCTPLHEGIANCS